ADQLRVALAEAGGRITGGEPRLPNYAAAAFPDGRGEGVLLALDLAGGGPAGGSARASRAPGPTPRPRPGGVSLAGALRSLRLAAGYDTTPEEIERMFHVLQGLPIHARG